ncbi:MAG: hypothetical protein KIT69_06225 [Propionibacteriaceae bacterium]|nr:hypothetical protein [Propionibacteriaceae bacterium]
MIDINIDNYHMNECIKINQTLKNNNKIIKTIHKFKNKHTILRNDITSNDVILENNIETEEQYDYFINANKICCNLIEMIDEENEILYNNRDNLFNDIFSRLFNTGEVFPGDIRDVDNNKVYKHHKVIILLNIDKKKYDNYRYHNKKPKLDKLLPYILHTVNYINKLHPEKNTQFRIGATYIDFDNNLIGIDIELFYKHNNCKCIFSTIDSSSYKIYYNHFI